MKTAILFATHIWNDFISNQFNALKSNINKTNDLYVLLHKEDDSNIGIPADINYYSFNLASLSQLNYTPISERVYENNHFSLFQFYKDHPQYNHYWYIEYDVYFTGNWSYFFQTFEEILSYDFISSHIEIFNERPHWCWWKSLNFKGLEISKDNFLKSFNPIYRISSRALDFLDQKFKEGNYGHHEALMPSLLHQAGFSIGDLGGKGMYKIAELKEDFYLRSLSPFKLDDFYTFSTMRFLPIFNRDQIESYKIINTLFHPVKQ